MFKIYDRFSGLSNVGTFKQYYLQTLELTSVYNDGSIHVSAKLEGKKAFKTIENPGDYDDQYLIERCPINKHLIENVCDLVRAGQNF